MHLMLKVRPIRIFEMVLQKRARAELSIQLGVERTKTRPHAEFIRMTGAFHSVHAAKWILLVVVVHTLHSKIN